jgi:hypothetical protein
MRYYFSWVRLSVMAEEAEISIVDANKVAGFLEVAE